MKDKAWIQNCINAEIKEKHEEIQKLEKQTKEKIESIKREIEELNLKSLCEHEYGESTYKDYYSRIKTEYCKKCFWKTEG
jgi:Txe/YoeB family toxin of Txe-Axe toxin-antitoxin module